MKGGLFLVVGPSGVGKDSILDGARVALKDEPRFVFARRVITRDADTGGEDFDSVSTEEFAKLEGSGSFLARWQAHGLSYGLPINLIDQLREGRHVLANVSRAALAGILETYPGSIIVEITASPERVAERLRARGREDAADIAARLKRQTPDYPSGAEVISIANDDSLESAVRHFVDAIGTAVPRWLKLRWVPIDSWHENVCFLHGEGTIFRPGDYLGSGKVDVFNDQASVRAKVNVINGSQLIEKDEIGLGTAAFEQLGLPEGSELTLERTPSPESLSAIRTKIAGQALRDDQIDMVIRDIAENRYNGREISAFLVAASNSLDLDEVVALSRARAKQSSTMHWPYDLVVDKHSMGGVPGSRITMIVIPIVAAFGMIIPKTSSRAITSAAGTADAMEVVARVDLTAEDVRSVIDEANGCIAWNGRLNHSAVDDVMNSITRPLGIDSTRWAVASILSKKIAAGSTHVIIDIPTGPGMKTGNLQEGTELAGLFERVGERLGLEVHTKITDGSRPVGHGIGPALEVRDVYRVLGRDDAASIDLENKALDFAGTILEWSPSIGKGSGRAKAKELLQSGAALTALERIIDAQGRHDTPASPGVLVHEVRAPASGVVQCINTGMISGIARRAGAPMDKSAGVDLLHSVKDSVAAGEPLFLIHGSVEADVQTAVEFAETTNAFDVR